MSVGRLADTPLFQLSSGHRWTTVTNDEELISHLISLYFVWEHQTLPFLDRELFIEDFESGQGSFCSPFLVNAILALGSVSLTAYPETEASEYWDTNQSNSDSLPGQKWLRLPANTVSEVRHSKQRLTDCGS